VSKASKAVRNQIPEEERAGSHQDPKRRYPVEFISSRKDRDTGEIITKRQIHGYIDPVLRVYQGGGERVEIINYNLKTHPPLMSLMLEVWRRLLGSGDVDTWEMRDHQANTCYVISLESAKRVGVVYPTGMGKRFGVPLEYVTLVNAHGEIIREGNVYQPPLLVFGETDPNLYRKPTRAKAGSKTGAAP
jgi:hypothetical protein